MSESSPAKVAVVGAGSVGATLAYAIAMRGLAGTIALYDINKAKVEAEALDIGHGIQFMPQAEILGSDDIAVVAGADVVVITAGAKQKPGQSRLDLAASTVHLTQTILPQLLAVAPNAVYLMVTNPVDIVTYAAIKCAGLPPGRVFGSGTVLDSSRLRYLIAQHCQVAVQNVHAYVVGEHGDSELPLWSLASIGAVPLDDWRGPGLVSLEVADRDRIAAEVVQSAYRIIEGKGATNYAIGVAASRIIEAILADQRQLLPVSTLLDGYLGLDDVCLSVPTLISRSGAGERVPLRLSDAEHAGLEASAASLGSVARSLGL